jgi:hypothetical protein
MSEKATTTRSLGALVLGRNKAQLDASAQPPMLEDLTEEQLDELAMAADTTVLVTTSIGTVWSSQRITADLRRQVEDLSRQVADLGRMNGALQQQVDLQQRLARLAGTRALMLGETVAGLMGFEDAVFSAPRLDDATRSVSIVTVMISNNSVVDVIVPLHDTLHRFTIKVLTGDKGKGSVKTLHTLPDGTLDEDTQFIVRGFASFVRQGLASPEYAFATVSDATNNALVFSSNAGAGTPHVEQ